MCVKFHVISPLPFSQHRMLSLWHVSQTIPRGGSTVNYPVVLNAN